MCILINFVCYFSTKTLRFTKWRNRKLLFRDLFSCLLKRWLTIANRQIPIHLTRREVLPTEGNRWDKSVARVPTSESGSSIKMTENTTRNIHWIRQFGRYLSHSFSLTCNFGFSKVVRLPLSASGRWITVGGAPGRYSRRVAMICSLWVFGGFRVARLFGNNRATGGQPGTPWRCLRVKSLWLSPGSVD